MAIIIQQDATIYSSFISVNCSACFGWYLHPSSGARIIVSTVSGINETVTATCPERDWMGTSSHPFTTGSSNGLINTGYCRYNDTSSWWWVEIPPETCSAVVPIQSRSRQVAVTVSLMPNTVDAVIWAPDDGWRYHPKNVEQFTDINKLYIVASCWIIIATNKILKHYFCILKSAEYINMCKYFNIHLQQEGVNHPGVLLLHCCWSVYRFLCTSTFLLLVGVY